jgi:uncharacterized protein (TIGR02246 family)
MRIGRTVIVLGVLGTGVGSALHPAAAQAPAARATPGDRSADVAAIRALDELFIREYNQANSKALAAMFTEDAEVIDPSGGRFEGRTLVEEGFASTFVAEAGAKIAFQVESLRFVTPDVAQEEGVSVVTPVTGAPASNRFTVLYVKRDGKWLISSVREEPDPMLRPRDRLKDLEWMVGEWLEERPDAVVRVNCRWSDDGNFLLRDVTVHQRGKAVLTVAQRIGWDPLTKHFRSWDFDSEGGFGEGTWSRSGDRWVVKHSNVHPGGITSSATNILTKERSDLVRWTSTDRVLGDEAAADTETYVLVRIPPSPAPKPPSANPSRSPR